MVNAVREKTCEARELFDVLQTRCSEYSRSDSEEESAELSGEIEVLCGRILESCRRPVFPLDWDELNEAVRRGGSRYAREVIVMACRIIEEGGRVVVMRSRGWRGNPEYFCEFDERSQFTAFVSHLLAL